MFLQANSGRIDLSVKLTSYRFEAAWSGDIGTIKSLTLGFWGPDNDRIPLQITTEDTHQLTPFAIAVLRGHLDVAKAIMEIARAQYQPKETKGQKRFRMRSVDDDDYDSDGNSIADSEEDDEIRLYSDIIDDQFTVDNIGEISSQVKSTISPFRLLVWHCNIGAFLDHTDEGRKAVAQRPFNETEDVVFDFAPLDGAAKAGPYFRRNVFKNAPFKPTNIIQYAIWAENIELLRFLLDLGDKYKDTATTDTATNMNAQSLALVRDQDLRYARIHGRTKSLAELIKRTGVGIPLDEFVKESGVEATEKPRYYQGLSVHGKKRADWAAAGRGAQMAKPTEKHPPLLESAYNGSIESVEWFLSTAPMRHYAEFAKAHKNDPRLKRLAQAEGGFDKSISNWLGLRSKFNH
jgi:hypothetical protein